MSFASFAIGSNEVVATSIAPSIAVLIISAIRTNVIESSSAISSIFETATTSASTITSDGDDEVDPHVPLRAEHVDDPLERVVERVEERRASATSSRRSELPLARLHLVAVVVAEQVQQAVRQRARASRSPTTCGQRTTSPSARGRPSGSSSRPSIGNESTSVASSIPRCSRFSARISSRPDEREPELAVVDSLRAQHAARELDRRASSTSTPLRLSTSTDSTATSASARCRSPPRARGTPRRSAGRACGARRPGGRSGRTRSRRSRSRMSCTWIRPGGLVARQVDLRHVAGDDDLRAEAEPRQEHLHLLGRGVLRLVEDDEAVVQRAAAHERERRDLDRAALHVRVRRARGRACRRARRRAGAGTGRPWRACRRAGSRAARRPRPRAA